MNYRDYQKARDAAWRILIDCEVNALPVKITEICRKLRISVFTYREASVIIEALGLEAHTTRTDGLTIHADEAMILYNSALPPERCRFTIAHELGHIILGHIQRGHQPQSTASYRQTTTHAKRPPTK